MMKLLFRLAALPFLAGVAMAGQPTPLSDAQMDQVTAGFDVTYTLSNGALLNLEFGTADGEVGLAGLRDAEIVTGRPPLPLDVDP